jgi:type II secretory pathway component HofQ
MTLNKSITIFFMLIFLGISAYSQTNSAQKTDQCRYGETDFVGENIDLNVTNADIRDVLTYITEAFGCDFVIDTSIKEVPITTNLTNVSWNLALDAIVESQGLIIRVSNTSSGKDLLRVRDKKEDVKYGLCSFPKLDSLPLFTESIQLKTVPEETQKTYFEGLKIMLSKRLSRRGTIEIDDKTNNLLIVTDTRENLDAVRQLIAYLEILDGEKIESNYQ